MKVNIKKEAMSLQGPLIDEGVLQSKEYYKSKVMNKQREVTYDKELQNKEVSVFMMNGDLVEGIARDINEKSIIMSRNGDWVNKFKIDFSNINDLKVSEFPYFSMEHKRSLREKKIPRASFRYTESELKSLIGSYAFINYDGKIIDGQIIDTRYRDDEPSYITVESMETGEHKSIHDYRLRELEITGLSKDAHKFSQRLKDLELEFLVFSDEHNMEYKDLPNKDIDPDYMINEYFEARLSVLRGLGIDLNDYDYIWTHEVLDSFKKENGHESGESLNGDLKLARDIDKYYKEKKDFVDYIINEVQKIDWTEYSKRQEVGEIEALEYVYESGIFS